MRRRNSRSQNALIVQMEAGTSLAAQLSIQEVSSLHEERNAADFSVYFDKRIKSTKM